MTQTELNQLERDVEEARARLSGDLERLRSPATYSSFKDVLWAEARESRDELVGLTKETVDQLVDKAKDAADQLVDKTKEAADELVAKTKTVADDLATSTQEAVSDRASRFVADMKERAAANPLAVLAIGAGVAWRILRKPPITSMLVGGGLIALMRTNPKQPAPGAELVYQVGDLAIAAKEKVEEWSSGEMAAAAKEKVGQLSSDSGEVVARAGELAGAVKGTVEQWSSDVGETVWQVAGATRSLAERGSQTISDIVQDPEERDKYLLGAAAVALVAAVGIACQKRIG
jgi:vacuolar-type H+-ATPase subunit H